MKKYLSIMSKQTKFKCVGVIGMAFISSLLASFWPVRLGALYTSISNGTIRTIAQGLAPILIFGLIYLASECDPVIDRSDCNGCGPVKAILIIPGRWYMGKTQKQISVTIK